MSCVSLTFVPYYVVYKGTALNEYNARSTCTWGAVGFLLTQLAKLMFLATFVPLSGSTNEWDFSQEAVKALTNLADIGGVYLVLTSGGSTLTGDLRFLAVALGWATAESLVSRLAQLWLEARSLDFDWVHLTHSVEANIALVLHIAFVSAVWLATRRKGTKGLRPVIIPFLLFVSLVPTLLTYLRVGMHLHPGMVLGVYFAIALASAGVAFGLHSAFVRQTSPTK